ncbi:MAG: ribonuclease P [Methanomicrobium sp.]|jgi:ribonuclease P protein subunit RPR2|nr:ribonuclease P [Methanomicrobium sp.]MDD4299857.1 ribonuclease P [Methanomicrobium sp.]
MAKKNDKSKQKALAKERIICLFDVAGRFFKTDSSLSQNCIMHARIISMRYRIRIPKPYNKRYCRKCYSLLVPGTNVRTRIQRGKVIVTCKTCGNIRRYPITEKKTDD